MKAITEKTVIPLSLTAALLGAAMWMTNVYAKVEQVISQMDAITQIDRRLTVIETEIRYIKQQNEELLRGDK